MRKQVLAELILKNRRYRKSSLFLLFTNIVLLAVFYFNLISPALMPDNYANPAFLKFMESPEFDEIIVPRFEELKAYNDAPTRHSQPSSNLIAVDPSQLGVIVEVQYSLTPQQEAAADGEPRYRYDTHIRVRPAISTLAGFVGLEIVLTSLLIWGLRGKLDPVHAEFESEVLRGYFFPEASDTSDSPAIEDALLRLLSRFHVYATELQAQPRSGHSAWKITDEYDVQHALCALLRTHFDNVKPEEITPSLAGSSSRVDFLLVNEQTGIEAKMMRHSLTERELGKQLLLDLAQFPSHSQCQSLIFLVYDPTHMIRNPVDLRKGVIDAARGFPVEIIYSPPR
ncbi:hypothetical protein FOZ76_18705 [Verticiella sediminum]|uniref:Uncharacterized protein n=1 Tax=Verticiella sediminum TaxID=1247510 RepID=A0A556AE63_9BURK|nr:hypothetical protein [Verticiella sediminum]TSH91182.1 hypothetical protein FOZ76_18705 [Verticiella sediminum]